MVKDWGMSDKLGLRTIESPRGFNQGDSLGPSTNELVSLRCHFLFLHKLKSTPHFHGPTTSPFCFSFFVKQIDAEIKRILSDSYERAKNILKSHPKELKALAEALLKYETLDAEDIRAILTKEKKPSDSSLN